MDDVLAKLREARKGYLAKADALGEAIKVIEGEDDPGFQATPDMGCGLDLPAKTHTPKSGLSLKKGELPEKVLTMIQESGPICANEIAEALASNYPENYNGRKIESIRGSVSGTLSRIRNRKPKLRNLRWEKQGLTFYYWFESPEA